jgi:hypothetical protein
MATKIIKKRIKVKTANLEEEALILLTLKNIKNKNGDFIGDIFETWDEKTEEITTRLSKATALALGQELIKQSKLLK